MKRLTYPVVIALVTVALLAPAAFAQEETTIIEETTVYPEGDPAAGNTTGGTTASTTESTTGGARADATTAGDAGEPLPSSGGPPILAPVVAFLLGSGVVAFALLRRSRR